MSQVLVTESYLDDIADAIREKNGSEDTYTPAQMAGAIGEIHTADEVVLVSKSISANGIYNPASDSADGYSGVTVNVPNTYTVSDEGKVVSSGALVAQESQNVSQNGTYDTTLNNHVVVAVSNSYSASDEGKVVSSGELIAQTSRNVTENGTYDTTENNEVVVNVQGGGGSTLIPKSITQNGTYNPADDNADGYSEVIVNVSGGGTLTKIMNQGQVSTTSTYATANFDSSLNFADFNCLKIDLFREGVVVGTTIFGLQDLLNKNSTSFQFYIYDGTYTYKMDINKTNKAISCTSYSGDYVNLYVDVYGANV